MLLCFQHPWTTQFEDLTYRDFCYVPGDRSAGMPPANQKVVRRRVRGPIVTRLQLVPIFERSYYSTCAPFFRLDLHGASRTIATGQLLRLACFATCARLNMPCKKPSPRVIVRPNCGSCLRISSLACLSPRWNYGLTSNRIRSRITSCITTRCGRPIWPYTASSASWPLIACPLPLWPT